MLARQSPEGTDCKEHLSRSMVFMKGRERLMNAIESRLRQVPDRHDTLKA
jgi:hypothetical protein